MLSFLKSDPSQKNRSHLKNLVSMAMADGSIDQREWELLRDIARKLDLTEEDIQIARNNPDLINNVLPKKYREKVEQLYDLVCLMIADFQIDENELGFCRKMADKLNINPMIVDDLIDQVNIYLKNNQDPDQLLNTI